MMYLYDEYTFTEHGSSPFKSIYTRIFQINPKNYVLHFLSHQKIGKIFA